MMSSRLSSQAGFALLEVLLSITLAAVVTTFVAGGFTFGMRAWETSQRVETVYDAGLADRAVANWLAEAMWISEGHGRSAATLDFQGASNDVQFVSLSDGQTQTAGLMNIHLSSLAGRSGSRDVVVDTSIFRHDQDNRSISRIVLARNATLELAYYGTFGGSPLGWRRDWSHATDLPLLVEFRIISKEHGVGAATIVRLRAGDALPLRWVQ